MRDGRSRKGGLHDLLIETMMSTAEELMALIEANPSVLRTNTERYALQGYDRCEGTVVAHFPFAAALTGFGATASDSDA